MESPSRSGVFQSSTDARLESFAESISFDRRLYRQDIRGSIAHASMLQSVGLISENDFTSIRDTLKQIESEIESGDFPIRLELEDIHMHIESVLIDRIGDVGRKLHTARSRNDQVSTDARMWVREALEHVDSLLLELQKAFLGRCDRDMDVILPAYTHLQRAQPVLAPHYWLAYIEKLQRDRDRIADCRRRVNQSPLGVAAVAGTTLTFTALNFGGLYQSQQFFLSPDTLSNCTGTTGCGTVGFGYDAAIISTGTTGEYGVRLRYVSTISDPGGAFNGYEANWRLEGTMRTDAYSAVPVPAAAYLMGSGLIGLAGVARRRRKKS